MNVAVYPKVAQLNIALFEVQYFSSNHRPTLGRVLLSEILTLQCDRGKSAVFPSQPVLALSCAPCFQVWLNTYFSVRNGGAAGA